jgi:hypothetical protein
MDPGLVNLARRPIAIGLGLALAACASRSVLTRDQVRALRTLPDGRLAYPSPDGVVAIAGDADLTLVIEAGAPFAIRVDTSTWVFHADRFGSRVDLDLERDDLVSSSDALSASVDGAVITVPYDSIRRAHVREENEVPVLPIVAGTFTVLCVVGVGFIVVFDHPD